MSNHRARPNLSCFHPSFRKAQPAFIAQYHKFPTSRHALKCPPRPAVRKRTFPKAQQRTEDTFAIDAGRDLFFAAMTPDQAIDILNQPLSSLEAPDDRFIAAERLKFFPSEKATTALLDYVRKSQHATVLEDRVARRKCVETLGRFEGKYQLDSVLVTLVSLLKDDDPYLVEVTVWSLSQISEDAQVMEAVTEVLHNPDVEKRTVIRALLTGGYKPALGVIKQFADDPHLPTASAAMSAAAVLSDDQQVMKPIAAILKSQDLNVRRAAIDDIALAKYTPALPNVAIAPNSLVIRARAVRILMDQQKLFDDGNTILLDKLIWDHPSDLDLLGLKKETKKARDPDRNIRQLYKNDAIYAYLATRTLAEDHVNCSTTGGKVEKSYNDLGYFDYFGAYHVYKTLGWLRYHPAYDLLIDNAENLPPRFFNHQAGAIVALAVLGNDNALPVINKVGKETNIWELKYACLLASQRLGDQSLRDELKNDEDWLIRQRARSPMDFDHLKDSFL